MAGKGLHLLIDGLTATPPTTTEVRHLILAVVSQMGLHIIDGPTCYQLESHQEAFAVIAESHVSVLWWADGLVLVDLFSCKPFDADVAIRFFVEMLHLEHMSFRKLERMGVG